MSKVKNEQRFIEMRAVDNEEGKMIIEGYAIIYDQPATHVYGSRKFTEVIKRGALDYTDMDDVPLRYNHNDTWCIMARTRNKSLQLIKDERGLKIVAELIDTQSNRDIYKSIQEGLIDKMSFAFSVSDKGDNWTYGDEETVREVTAIRKLYDVSVVDTPFYDTTSVYARSFELLEDNLKQIDRVDLRKRKLQIQFKIKNKNKSIIRRNKTMNLEKLLQQAKEERATLYDSIATANNAVELDKIELDIRKADMKIKNLEEQIAERDAGEGEDPAARGDNDGEGPEQRTFNPLGTYGGNPSRRSIEGEEDMYSSLEYRQAFRNYIVSGTPIPEKFKNEERSAELTVVGDVAAVIPTTIMNKVIEDLTVEGKIINKITQTQYQGGVAIPISEIMPEATWLSDESTPSDEKKAKMEAKITFGYHMLEAKVAIGLLAATVALPIFEQTMVKQLKKAMIRAIETAVVSGSGSGQPLGLTKIADLPEKNIVTFSEAEVGTVKGWAKAEAAVDEAYDNDSLVYMMNKQTWEMHLNSMVDTTGQKIGLGRIDEKGRKILNGREVLTTDQFKGYDNASEEEVFGALVNLEQYLLNSNLSMYYKKYFDEDKNKWIHKCLMIVDGKMAIGKDSSNKLVGAGGLIYLKKKSVSRARTKNLQEDKE